MAYILFLISAVVMYLILDPEKPPVTLSSPVAILLVFIGIFTIYNWRFVLGVFLVGYVLPTAIWGLKLYNTEQKKTKQRQMLNKSNGTNYKKALLRTQHELSYFDKEYTEKYKEYEALPKSYKEFLIGVEESLFVYYGKFIVGNARNLNGLDKLRKSNRILAERVINNEKALKSHFEQDRKFEKEMLSLRKQIVSDKVGFKIL